MERESFNIRNTRGTMSQYHDRSVFILMYVQIKVEEGEAVQKTRAQPVVFDALPKLYQHLVDLVKRNIHLYEERFAVPLLKYGDDMDYNKFIMMWRYAQDNNGRPTGFEAYWDDEPQLVL